MKKWLFASLLLSVLSTDVFANTMLARYTYGGTTFLAPGCAWRAVPITTPYQSYNLMVLTCSGVDAASYEGNKSPGMLVARPGHTVAQATGGTGPSNTYNYVVYRNAAACQAPWQQGSYTDVGQASAALSTGNYYNYPVCNSPCRRDIATTPTGYTVVCH